MWAALQNRGVRAALASAVLFGAGTPAAKLLLAGDVNPWLLAGLLYTGSGVGLALWRLVRRPGRVRIARREVPALAGAVFFGGLAAPVLLMLGLAGMPASGASLLLNAEGVFTALLAWVVFRENVDRRIVAGMAVIVAGAVILSVPTGAQFASPWAALPVVAACACWALDNNLTRKVALNDATWLAALKGSLAGPVNLGLAFLAGATVPPLLPILGAMSVGLVAYGVSLVLFIVAMRHIGTARTGAYFSIAPFFGAMLAVGFGEPITWPVVVAAILMGIGVWLHLTEVHEHEHTHVALTHEHWHVHDDHHQHTHPPGQDVPAGIGHRHLHAHEAITHSHPHYPDSHHQHHHG
ncbi:MAG: EamA family transporter [Acidobacteriota bacterium]|nr:EamA family transporter [Acidobacteriota bacterium]